MKLTLLFFCLVTLGAVAAFYGDNDCLVFYPDSHSEILPKTNSDKCLYECMLRITGMVKEDGLIKVEKFVDFLKKSKEYDDTALSKIAAVMETMLWNCNNTL